MIVLAYNDPAALHRTLDSLVSQTNSPDAYEVVDNGSDDETLIVARVATSDRNLQ